MARGDGVTSVSLSRSTTTIVPRMNPWPAPQMREHSKV